MLINLQLLFAGGGILGVVIMIVVFGTVGKAVAAYLASWLFRLPLSSGNMMFGLTSAHAAGASAMLMVGMKMEVEPGVPLVTDDMLNGVVIMILFTCIISTIVTERSAQQITLRDKEMPEDSTASNSEEKVLIPMKYPEYAQRLVNLAMMMRNPKNNTQFVGLNVVYDDENMRSYQEQGRRLLEQVTQYAAGSDVKLQTQVRVAANIANGIKHAFKEFNASEIIMGLHDHKNVSKRFWGEFIQSLFNGLNRQIVIVQCNQPLNTIRRIHVAVPSRAEFEPGFCRWMERVARMAGNLDCKIEFHGQQGSLSLIRDYIQNRHPNLRAEYTLMAHWIELPALAASIREDHMFVVVTARKGTVSYKLALEQLPEELTRHFSGKSLMIIYPDQYGEQADAMTFAAPQHQEEQSAYNLLMAWIRKKLLNKK